MAAGWGTASIRALVAVVSAGATAEALAFLGYLAAREHRPSVVLTARLGDLLFLWFHHVPLAFETSGRAPGVAVTAEAPFRFTLGLGVLGGTAVAVWLLAAGGRAVARTAMARPSSDGGPAGEQPRGLGDRWPSVAGGLHGTKIAVPYAAACLAASGAVRLTLRLPEDPLIPPLLSVHPLYVWAFAWPLIIAVVAGFGGGFGIGASRRAPDPLPSGTPGGRPPVPSGWDRWLDGALAGGTRMLLVAMAGSFIGLLVLAVAHPAATTGYFDAVFRRGPRSGGALLAGTVLAAPNLAAWLLFPSMGSCIAQSGARSICLISYSHFPAGPAGVRLGGPFGRLLPGGPGEAAPPAYLLFLLVPVVAVIIGGMHASRRAGARTVTEAGMAGGSAGLVFAALSLGLIYLASITGTVGAGLGRTAASAFWLGPQPVASFILALAWGVLGGALGGVAGGRDRSAC